MRALLLAMGFGILYLQFHHILNLIWNDFHFSIHRRAQTPSIKRKISFIHSSAIETPTWHSSFTLSTWSVLTRAIVFHFEQKRSSVLTKEPFLFFVERPRKKTQMNNKMWKGPKKKFTIEQKHPLAKYRHTFSQIWHTKFDMQIHVVISIFAVWRTRNNNRERKKKCSNTQHTIDSFVSCVDRSRRFFDYYYSVSDVTRLAHNKLLLGAPFELRQKILLIKNSIALKNHNTNNGK